MGLIQQLPSEHSIVAEDKTEVGEGDTKFRATDFHSARIQTQLEAKRNTTRNGTGTERRGLGGGRGHQKQLGGDHTAVTPPDCGASTTLISNYIMIGFV